MHPYLKDGQLHLTLNKTERRKVNEALGIFEVLARLNDINPKLRESAAAILENVSVVIDYTGKEEVQQQELPL